MAMQQHIRQLMADMLAQVLWWSGASLPQRRAANHLTIVTFHRVLPSAELARYPYPGIAVTPQELDWMLGYFKQFYAIANVSTQWARHVQATGQDRPLLAITFDDGQWDNLAYAAPVLAKHELTATFYIPVEHVQERKLIWHDSLGYALAALRSSGQEQAILTCAEHHGIHVDSNGDVANQVVQGAKALTPQQRQALVEAMVERAAAAGQHAPEWGRLMTWDEIRSLQQQGHEIGSHSMSHNLLPQLDDATLRTEITQSKHVLEHEMQQPLRSFCYPNGDHDARARAMTKQAGYENAVSTTWGINDLSADPYALARCDIDSNRYRNRHGQLSRPRTAMRLGNLQPGLAR